MKTRILIAIVFISLTAYGQKFKKSAYKKVSRVARDSVDAFIKRKAIPGLAVTVSIGGEIVWSQGFGYADLEQRVPVDPAKTRFRIGSISKSLTAAALAKLYEQQKIFLDSSIYYYLPDYPKHGYNPTVRQVAGHLAGIRHYKGNEFLTAQHYDNTTDALSIFKNDSLVAPPGTKYHYSSYGFNLLSAVLERASGKDFLSLMNAEVFKPLNLTHTIADITDSIISYRTRFYIKYQDQWRNAPYVDNSYKWAGGGFLSTSEDIIRFASALLQNKFLRAETVALLTTAQRLNNGTQTTYGIGFFTGKDAFGKQYFGHGGGSVGGTCDLVIYPNEQVAVTILTNLSNAALGRLANQIANIYMNSRQ